MTVILNNAATISVPITSGTQSANGIAGDTNEITFNTLSASGSTISVFTKYLENSDGSLTMILNDYATNGIETLNLPALSSATAITEINRTNSSTTQFNGLYTIELGGANANYLTSTIQYMNIFGTASGNNVIVAPNANNAVTSITTGSGNDTITGSGFYSIMDGGGGTNTLNGLGGTNYFRMSPVDNGTDTINTTSGSSNDLQIYVTTTTFPKTSENNWNFEQVGTNLVGFVKDANGNTSNFTINNEYASASSSTPLNNFLAIIYTEGLSTDTGGGISSISSTGSEIFPGTQSSETFDLTSIKGLTLARVFGNGTNDVVKTTSGIQLLVYADVNDNTTVIYPSAMSKYMITPTISNGVPTYIQVTPPGVSSTSTDYLYQGVDRIQFSDTSVAFDIMPSLATDSMGNAGIVAKTLGSIFGASTVISSPVYVGIGLNLVDGGTSYQNLLMLAMGVTLGSNFTNTQEINLLFTNVIGHAPSVSDLAYWNNAIASGAYTQASLAQMAADSAQNATNINLVGLETTGLKFTPVAGAYN